MRNKLNITIHYEIVKQLFRYIDEDGGGDITRMELFKFFEKIKLIHVNNL